MSKNIVDKVAQATRIIELLKEACHMMLPLGGETHKGTHQTCYAIYQIECAARTIEYIYLSGACI